MDNTELNNSNICKNLFFRYFSDEGMDLFIDMLCKEFLKVTNKKSEDVQHTRSMSQYPPKSMEVCIVF